MLQTPATVRQTRPFVACPRTTARERGGMRSANAGPVSSAARLGAGAVAGVLSATALVIVGCSLLLHLATWVLASGADTIRELGRRGSAG